MLSFLGVPVACWAPLRWLRVLCESVKGRSGVPRGRIHPRGKATLSPGKEEPGQLNSLREPERRVRVVVVGLLHLLSCFWVLLEGRCRHPDHLPCQRGAVAVLLMEVAALQAVRARRGHCHEAWGVAGTPVGLSECGC